MVSVWREVSVCGGLSGEEFLSRGFLIQRPIPPPGDQTEAGENITFSQTRLRAVIINDKSEIFLLFLKGRQ